MKLRISIFIGMAHTNGECDIRKPIWYLDSGCSRHMTGVKSYLHKYVEQPGPKVVFGDDSTCVTEGYGSIKYNGSVFSKQYWTEAVATACYTQNRSTIVKRHLKTPYEFFCKIIPNINFVHVFGCLVYIHNHKDHLGKFDENADDGYLLGYSLVSKAFRVFNTRRQQTEETYHIRFDESPDAIKFSKPSVDNINIADNERYLPYEYLHPYEPSQSQNDQSVQNDEILNDDHSEHSNQTNYEKIIDNLPNTEDIQISKHSSSPRVENTSVHDTIPILNPPLPIPSVVTPAPQDRWSQDKHIELVNIIGNPGAGMLTRAMAKELGATLAYECLFVDFLSEEEPNKVSEALQHPGWVDAMQDKLNQFARNNIWTLVPAPYDYDETFAPVARHEAIRIFLAFATYMNFIVYQMDVKSAFLNGKLKEEVYVKQSLGFESNEFPNHVRKLDKALYGLKQAPRAWYETLSTFLTEHKFVRGKIYNNLFVYKTQTDVILVQSYVDDIIFGSTSTKLCKQFAKLMTQRYEMSMIGVLTYFLGFQIKQSKRGISINQEKYVKDLLKKYDINGSLVKTPMVPPKNLGPDLSGKAINETQYRGMIGSIMYLTASRPDIQFLTCLRARYQANPKESHLIAIKRIFKYLKGTPSLGLWYPKLLGFDLKGYSDSDYAGCNMDRKITSGGIRGDIGRKTGGLDQISNKDAAILYCLANGVKVDYAKLIWEDIIHKLSKKNREKFVPYPRFPKAKSLELKVDLKENNFQNTHLSPRLRHPNPKLANQKKTQSSSAKDKSPSYPLPPTPVVGEMHKEAQQAAGGPTYLGATGEEGAHPQLSSGHDALADSTTEVDPRLSAPNDSIPSQQDQTKFAGDGLKTAHTDSSINEESRADEISKKIKLEDLLDILKDTRSNFFTPDSPQDEPIIISYESEEEEKDELEQQKAKAEAEVASLKAEPSYLDINQLTDLLVAELKNIQWELPVVFQALPSQVSSVQKKLKTLDSLPSLLNKVTDTLNRFTTMLENALAGQASASPAEGEKNTSMDAETNLQNELVDLLGIDMVEQYHNKKLLFEKYCDKMLKRRKSSKIINCDVLAQKGPILLKVYKEDGTIEVIENFKVSDLHLAE
ncbi:retrovirus-related pol polyprotein from transposon TNT 1-94 [Tanacetum coccineum]